MKYILTAHDAELNAERVMRGWGYEDAKATTGGADGGIDVTASTALAQVKWRGGMVSRPEIQKLVGAAHGSGKELFFFAASGFTKQAVDYAKTAGVRLYVYDPTGRAESYTGSDTPQGRVTSSVRKADMLWLLLVVGSLIASMILMLLIVRDV